MTRVETVIQMRSCESRSTKLTLPIGLPVDAVGQNARVSVARHVSRQSVPKFEIRNVAVGGEREAVRQRACQVTRRFAVRAGKARRNVFA